MSALAVKSVSGSASTWTALRMALKLSVVATSTSMRAGRSARAQTMPESTETSPDWMPWVMTGRSAARLSEGLAMPSSRPTAAVAPTADRNRRRVSDARLRMVTAIGPPPSNHGGPCVRRLTTTQRFDDDQTTGRNAGWVEHLRDPTFGWRGDVGSRCPSTQPTPYAASIFCTSLTRSRRCTGLERTLAFLGAAESELSATAAKP